MSRTTKIEGQLEIDHDRGVIYFHSNETGMTMLRICSLPKPIPRDRQLDITHMFGTDWAAPGTQSKTVQGIFLVDLEHALID